jgi:GntR family transcriptional regulator/MocR family aminotransferase
MQLPLNIVAHGSESLQQQITQQIRCLIHDGRLAPGTRMPATRELASDLGVSRNTVIGAFQRLIAEGCLESREPVGTFVAQRIIVDRVAPPVVTSQATPPSRQRRGKTPACTGRNRACARRNRQPHHVARPHAGQVGLDCWLTGRQVVPLRSWGMLLARALHRQPHQLCEYVDPQGMLALREAIVSHIGATRGIATDAGRVLITNGIQEPEPAGSTADCPGRGGGRGKPLLHGSQPRVCGAWRGAGGVPVDDQGMRTDALPRRAALAYVTPSHQYPLGGTLPLERREALLAWARNCGAYVLEDDYDSDFFYDRAPLLALKSLDHHDQVVYLGTFSKTLGAGLRIGYMVLPHSLCQAAVNAKAMLNNSQSWLEQAALAAFMAEGGYEHHVRACGACTRIGATTCARPWGNGCQTGRCRARAAACTWLPGCRQMPHRFMSWNARPTPRGWASMVSSAAMVNC